MLKKIRVVLAWVFWIGITLLLLDFTGTLHAYLGWMAKVQFLPAVLAVNVGVIFRTGSPTWEPGRAKRRINIGRRPNGCGTAFSPFL